MSDGSVEAVEFCVFEEPEVLGVSSDGPSMTLGELDTGTWESEGPASGVATRRRFAGGAC